MGEMTVVPEGRCGECLLYAAIAGMGDGLVLLDRKGRISYINRSAIALLSLAGRRVVERPLRTLVRERGLVRLWAASLRDPRPASVEVRLPAGSDRLVRATVSPCVSVVGESIGKALLLRDVTDEKRVQVELSESVARRLVAIADRDEPARDLPPLTRREEDILTLLAVGLGNAAIAARLRVTPNTGASHLKRLYPKLGVHTRAQAAAFALAHGVKPAPAP